MLIAAKSRKEITTLKRLLSSEFEMRDLGAAKEILGMQITGDRKAGLLFLSQHAYIEKVLQRFNMHDAQPVSTPISPHFKLSPEQCASSDEDIEYMPKVLYCSAVGSLMYAIVCSRPNLSYV
jgi:ATP-binding cassette subfamily B (MDR/TAP) protein 1